MFGTFDIESNDWNDFEVMGFFDSQDYYKFENPKAFLKFIDDRKYENFRLYAHNGGRFDFLFMVEPMYKLGWSVNITPRGGGILYIKVDTGRINFTFADSYALLPASLEKLCESFGVEHQKIKFDFTRERVRKTDKKLLHRMENDCIGLYEILQKFFKQDFIHEEKLTIASQALDTFTKQFKRGDLIQTRIEYEDTFRKYFYSGGRVEVYKGAGQVNCYDVNSLYPFIMSREMPSGECYKTGIFKPGDIGFYKVAIKSTPDFYIPPYLIKKDQHENVESNIYVNGKGTYFLSGEMLTHLKKEYGVRFDVVEGLYFKKRDFIFAEYVDFFFTMKRRAKKDGDTIQYYLAKLFLNLLYGKLGQRREYERITRLSKKIHRFRMFDDSPVADRFGLVLVPEFSHSKYILPYLAAYITDGARLHHWKLMQEHPEKMFYCDTDSLFTSAKYKTGEELGELSYNGNWQGLFLQPKTYALKNGDGEDLKFKGFDADEFTFSDFKESLTGEKILTQEREKLLSYKECITRKTGIIRKKGAFLKVVKVKKIAFIKDKETGELISDKRKILKTNKTIFDTQAYNFKEVTQ